MAAFFSVVVILLGVCATTFIYLRTRSKDVQRLEAEMDEDFSEEFELDEYGQPSEKGMEEMVDWLEDDLRETRLRQSTEIESFQELTPKQSDKI
jgi:hypothetical protein